MCCLIFSFGPARDQGSRETCLAFALSDAHAAKRQATWAPLSCEYLFYQAKQRDRTPSDQGTTISAIRAGLDQNGQPLESGWPYLKSLPADLRDWKPPVNAGQLYRRGSRVDVPAFDQVWNKVEANDPIVLGITISAAFYTPDTQGLVDSGEALDPNLRHAVVAVATGARGKERILLVRNSWGGGWGLSGYAWLTETYVGPRLIALVTLN
jgi:hypothetical protein